MNAELIRAGLIDLDTILQARRLGELSDKLAALMRLYRERKLSLTLAELNHWPWLADELARLTRIERTECRTAAEEHMSYQAAALRVIRQIAAECAAQRR